MIRKDIIDLFRVPAGSTVRLKDHNSGWAQTEEMEELGKDALKERSRQILDQNLADLTEAQELLYADDRYAVLIVLQAMDAAGKDGTIKHVMSGVNPQGSPGVQLQEALGRGPGSQLPLAHMQVPARARADRDLQSVLLRRRPRREESTPKYWRPRTSRPRSLARSSGTSVTRTSTPSSGTWSGTGRWCSSFS